MFSAIVILLRWAEMMGAMILFGSSLFCLYAFPSAGAGAFCRSRWPRLLLGASAGAILAASVLGFPAQTVVLAGSIKDAMQRDALGAAAEMSFGRSSFARIALAGLVLAALAILRRGRSQAWVCAIGGALICASFAWMGHGASTPGAMGWAHLATDVLHTWAAGAWVGALVGFAAVLRVATDDPLARDRVLYDALRRFAGLGSGLVAVLIATGLVNGAFVIGLSGLPKLLSSTYGRLLVLKLVLFVGMIGLAAANRFRLTPRLGADLSAGAAPGGELRALSLSVLSETGLSIAVIALVAWFGTLAPS